MDYVPKKGKTGNDMKSFFEHHCSLIQTCQYCQSLSSLSDNIVREECQTRCDSICTKCIDEGNVCCDCKREGQVNILPNLRACRPCLEAGIKCCKIAVLVLTVDCEEGNKQAMISMNNIENPHLQLLATLPDSVHVGKSLKASFANWYLKLGNERGNLAILGMLRNRASQEVKKNMKKFLPSNDHVRNKDRQDPKAVIKLTERNLTEYLSTLGFVGHTIIPETDRFTESNKVGMYPCPISIATGQFGYLLFLTQNSQSKRSSLYIAQLHNPVQKITMLLKDIEATKVHCQENVVFLVSMRGPIVIYELENGAVTLNLAKVRKKEEIAELMKEHNLSSHGTVKDMKERLRDHIKSLEDEYNRKGYVRDHINFWEHENQPEFEAIHVIDSGIMYGASASDKCLFTIKMSKDCYGLRGAAEHLISYGIQWGSVTSMAVHKESLYVAHLQGIVAISLTSGEGCLVVPRGQYYHSPSPSVQSYKSGILYVDPKSHVVRFWDRDRKENEIFAGSTSEGNKDGLSKECQFHQPTGLSIEFDNVVYVCDSQTSCIKVFTSLAKTAEFLDALGKIYKAFSVHEKRQKYIKCSLQDAILLLNECLQYLRQNELLIREEMKLNTNVLNGPQGNVASKTIDSVAMLKDGLIKLERTLEQFDYDAVNLLSCMTMDVENMHSIVHHKSAICTALEYARNFGNAVKEGLKRTASWAAYYYTNSRSWYPLPDRAMTLSDIDLAIPSQPASLSKEDTCLMKEWAHAYGACVRQRTVRQETTMAKAGTLPSYLYQRQILPEQRVAFLDGVFEDGALSEYDSSSEEEINEEDEVNDDIDDIGVEANFLIGTKSRFGRTIRYNNRFIS